MTAALVNWVLKPFNFDVFCTGKKFLVFNLVSRDLKIKYRRSFLGFFWTILHPLGLCGIYYLVFKMFLKIQIPHYVAFILSGVIPWTFFSTSVIEGTETLQGNSGLLTKVPIPTQVFPFVACVTNLITLFFALPILATVSLSSGVYLGWDLLYLPVLCSLLFLIAYSLALILSVVYVYLRDLKHAIGLLLQIWFYATPILYGLEMVPENLRWITFLNPVGGLFICFHSVFMGEALSINYLLIGVAWALAFYFCAILVQKRFARTAVELL